MYFEAHEVGQHSVTPPARQEQLTTYTRRIDGHFCSKVSASPAYIPNQAACVKIEAFRLHIDHLASIASSKVPLIQAPCYVGCSAEVMMDHSDAQLPETWLENEQGQLCLVVDSELYA